MHTSRKPFVVKGMVHSKNALGEIEVHGLIGDNDYKVKVVETGTFCHAIYNGFTGLLYADDVYGKVDPELHTA